jgi:AcrR family transcriptional regulator
VASERRPGRPRRGTRAPGASRRELLDAAAAEFAAVGYDAASVERVIARAGLSKGTFYWAFTGKEELFLALLEERFDAPARAVVDVLRRTPPDQPTAPAISAGLTQLFTQDPEVIGLLHEYWAAAARDAGHAERYRQRHHALRTALAAALAERHEQTGVALTMPAEELAEAFLALAVGLGMAATVDPGSVRGVLFGEIASLVYDGMVLRAQGAGRS